MGHHGNDIYWESKLEASEEELALQLAKFAAEFLGLLHVTDFYFFPPGSYVFTIQDSKIEDYFFRNPEYAPQLAHLAKLKMRSLSYYYKEKYLPGFSKPYGWCFHKNCKNLKQFDAIKEFEHENEFIALWRAIKEVTK